MCVWDYQCLFIYKDVLAAKEEEEEEEEKEKEKEDNNKEKAEIIYRRNTGRQQEKQRND